MKCRAMPKYLVSKDIINKELSFNKNNRELYFNSGRSALAFLLKNLNLKNIALQPFNCKAVLEAIKTVNYNPIFLDIKLTDFSLDFKELVNCKTRIDVLLITHYQGIPNIQYKEIIITVKKIISLSLMTWLKHMDLLSEELKLENCQITAYILLQLT